MYQSVHVHTLMLSLQTWFAVNIESLRKDCEVKKLVLFLQFYSKLISDRQRKIKQHFSISIIRSSRLEVFLRKGVQKICSKFTGETLAEV